MILKKIEGLSSAKNVAFRFLGIRPRSVKEMVDKLSAKGFSPDLVDQTISYLKQHQFLDDEHFARDWVSCRLKRPYGINKIILELKQQKGVDSKIVAEAIQAAQENYDEEAIVLQLAHKRAARYKDLDPVKLKKRTFDYLAQRGFTLDSINKVIKQL